MLLNMYLSMCVVSTFNRCMRHRTFAKIDPVLQVMLHLIDGCVRVLQVMLHLIDGCVRALRCESA